MKALRPSSRRGFALLLTLILVSFAAAIAVLFLLSARQERSGTESYAQGARVRQLADTTVNIVMGQINAATREGTQKTPISWASQPGMIRTYKNDGTLSNAYKLYSWPNMIEGPNDSTPFNPDPTSNAPDYPSASWYSSPMQYTDLNAPVTVSSGGGTVQVYPIIDPNVANSYTGVMPGPGAASNNNLAKLDWDFFNEVAYENDNNTNGYAVTGGGNVLPMPVQWLYILQDGTWVYPSGFSGTNTASFDSTVVTSTNPIVGRVAFWTDDETNKVNLNTAAEGSYWDWPKAGSQDEVQFAANPPNRNEFWRNSGHPATTSLSAIFPDLFGYSQSTVTAATRWVYPGNPAGIGGGAQGAANPNYVNGMQMILGAIGTTSPANSSGIGLTPRYTYGVTTGANPVTGSRGGVYPAPYNQTYAPITAAYTGTFVDGTSYYAAPLYSPVALPGNRLYATPDELFFSPPGPTAVVARSTENNGLNAMTQQSLSQRFFFITTDSRAPETTLFNTPRVSMWPITWPYPASYFTTDNAPTSYSRGVIVAMTGQPTPDSGTGQTPISTLDSYAYRASTWTTPQEDMLAFCSTLNTANTTNPQPYYFQRQNPNSSSSDWSSIRRNRLMSDYVRGMVAQPEPGFGDSLENAWGKSNADWITLECMDYCRSMINQYTFDPSDSVNGTLKYSFTGITNFAWSYNNNGTAAAGSSNERMAQSATPLRIAPAGAADIGAANYFTGTPPANNSHQANKTDAYVTQGAFPSLKEVAMEFIATQRLMPGYVGPVPVPNIPTTTIPLTADPFYWANLINLGPPSPSHMPSGTYGCNYFGPAYVSSMFTLNSGSMQSTGLGTTNTNSTPDGRMTDTGISNLMEKYNMYPVGAQTTYMKAFLLFNFAGLRDGTNAAPNPTFWIKVTGGDSFTTTTKLNQSPNQGTTLFASAMSSEYHGRYSYQSTDTVFQNFKAGGTNIKGGSRLFLPTNVPTYPPAITTSLIGPNSGNWTMCSVPIPTDPSDIVFKLNAGKLNVALYAEYGTAGSKTPETDPTGVSSGSTDDAAQFITSYNVDFSGYSNGTLGVPIAPRWNVRQARSVPFPQPNHPVAYVTGGTGLQPSLGTTNYAYQAGNTGWVLTEVVPDVAVLSGWTWQKTPTPSDHTDIRDTNSGLSWSGTVPINLPFTTDSGNTKSLDSTSSYWSANSVNNNQWMMYASVYGTGTSGSSTATAAWTGTNNYLTGSTLASNTEYVPSPPCRLPISTPVGR